MRVGVVMLGIALIQFVRAVPSSAQVAGIVQHERKVLVVADGTHFATDSTMATHAGLFEADVRVTAIREVCSDPPHTNCQTIGTVTAHAEQKSTLVGDTLRVEGFAEVSRTGYPTIGTARSTVFAQFDLPTTFDYHISGRLTRWQFGGARFLIEDANTRFEYDWACSIFIPPIFDCPQESFDFTLTGRWTRSGGGVLPIVMRIEAEANGTDNSNAGGSAAYSITIVFSAPVVGVENQSWSSIKALYR